MAAKRNYKDSLFRAIFKDKKNLLSLYNAISDQQLTDWRLIRLHQLKGVLFNIMRNDLAFTIGKEEIVLMEEQSSPNGNMPLRLFLYLAKIYQHDIPAEDLYRQATVPLPAPHFHVFYLGQKNLPPISEQHLSDAFASTAGDLDLIVHVYNITEGVNTPLFPKCPALHQYSRFVGHVEQLIQHGQNRDVAVRNAIQYARANGILADFLKAHESEVYDMINMKYDLNTAIKVAKEEAHAQGESQGIRKGAFNTLKDLVKDGLLPIAVAAKKLGVSESDFRKMAML